MTVRWMKLIKFSFYFRKEKNQSSLSVSSVYFIFPNMDQNLLPYQWSWQLYTFILNLKVKFDLLLDIKRDLGPCVSVVFKNSKWKYSRVLLILKKNISTLFLLEKKNVVVLTNTKLLLCHEEIVSSLLALIDKG